MPATPATSTTETVDPAIGMVTSDTIDPFFGIEVGRTYLPPPVTTVGGEGTDEIKVTKAK